MTHLTQGEWDRLTQIHKIEPGEARTDWVARILAIAEKRAEKPEPERLPYKDAREPGEDDAA